MKSSKQVFYVIALLAALILPSQLCLAAGGLCEYPLGDINQDNVVDWSDLGLMADQWLQSSGTADLDASGNIDLLDYALLAADWGAVGNCSPVVDAGIDQEITLPAQANLASASATDDGLPNPPGAVTTQWTKISGPNDVTFGDASVVGTTASFAGPGVYVLRLTANDGDMITYDELTVTVNPEVIPNNPPEVNAGDDQEITLPASASLDGTVTDDGQPNPPAAVTTLWTVVSRPDGPNDVNFADATAVDTTAIFGGPGVYVLRLTADDSALSAYDEVQITVDAAIPNTAPVVNAGTDASITYPTLTVSLDGTVTDDGLPNPPAAVTTLWSKVSGTGTVTFDNASAVDTIAHFPAAGGVFVLALDANDGELTSHDEVTITVVGQPQWSEAGGYCYVDGITGDDLAAGTSAAPYKTITKAFSVAGSGRKLVVWGGGGGGRPATQTYNETNLTAGVSGASGSPVNLKRDPASGEAIIDDGGGSAVIYSQGRAYWTIDGFTCTNAAEGIYVYQAGAIGWTIKNCRVKNCSNRGIYLRTTSGTTIDNCAVYNNSTGGNYANIYVLTSTGITITQSTMYDSYIGVQCITGPASITTLKDCIISGSSSNTIKNDSSHSCTISPITYCDVTGTINGIPALGATNKTTNPLLVDPANGDMHLGTGSPAHNADSGSGDMGYIYGGQAL